MIHLLFRPELEIASNSKTQSGGQPQNSWRWRLPYTYKDVSELLAPPSDLWSSIVTPLRLVNSTGWTQWRLSRSWSSSRPFWPSDPLRRFVLYGRARQHQHR